MNFMQDVHKSKVFVDTNVFMSYSTELFNIYDELFICDVVLSELDKHKTSSDSNKQFQARQTHRAIKKNKSKIKYCMKNGDFQLPDSFNLKDNDNKIISIYGDLYNADNSIIAISNDSNFQYKCECLGLPVEEFGHDETNIYLGYKKLSGDTDFINNLFHDLDKGINSYNFLTNEYLILYNNDLNNTFEYRFDGNKFVDLRLPPSKVIKGRNSLQRCSLDLLINRDIPIKIIAGGFGTGKTISAVKIGLYHTLDKNYYKTLSYIRNPIPVDDTDIGFLPGSKAEKISDYCRPFLQYVNTKKDELSVDDLVKNGKIKMDTVSFLKGVSIEDSFVIMDEAEDLNLKLLKTIGSRIGSKSCIVFTGDWEQSEGKYKYDNGLLKLIQQKKGDPLIGVVVLEEVLRSPVSKLFNELK
jgi:PhoH-like ATPase